jgi:hypothetical protein
MGAVNNMPNNSDSLDKIISETPIVVSLEIYDNSTKRTLVNEGYSTDSKVLIAAKLKKIAKDLEEGSL